MIHYVIFRRSEWQRLGGLQILNPEFIIQDSPGLHNLEDFTVQVLSGVFIVLIILVYYYSTERYIHPYSTKDAKVDQGVHLFFLFSTTQCQVK